MRAMTIVAVSMAVLVSFPTAAAAATRAYTVHACKVAGVPAPIDGWSAVSGWSGSQAHISATEYCEQGGPLSIWVSTRPDTMSGLMAGSWSFTAPPDTTVVGVRAWRRVDVGGPGAPSYTLVAGAQSIDPFLVPIGDRTRPVTAANLDARGIEARLTCNPGCQVSSTQRVQIDRVEIDLRDESPPEIVGAPGGRLLQRGHARGKLDFAVPFIDRGGGVVAATLVIDGIEKGTVKVADQRCRSPYVFRVPCPTSGRFDFVVDTSQLSAGRHVATVRAVDVAGNVGTLGNFPFSVVPATIATGATPVTIGVEPPLLLVVRFADGKTATRAAYGRPPRVVGQVMTAGGQPVANAPIQASVRAQLASAQAVPQPVIVADEAGRFELQVPRGPSRELHFAYGTASVTLTLAVPAPITLNASRTRLRNGQKVTFSGRIPGVPASARDRVELQVRSGGRWVRFQTPRLRRGAFTSTYRFERTDRRTTYTFRAQVRSSRTFPFADARSPTVKLEVRP